MARPLRTTYYDHKGAPLQVNCAKHVQNAVLRIVYHMHADTYRAWSAEVYDAESGTLHAVVRRATGEMRILYGPKARKEQHGKD